MSHVLLVGDEQKVTAVRGLLLRWGVTVGWLEFVDSLPTVQECDAVILVRNIEEYRDACLGALPDGPGGAADCAAPLIFITDDSPGSGETAVPGQVLGALGYEGEALRTALRSAFAAARDRRGQAAAEANDPLAIESDSYRHFLGHELRSPLTAIKTSLEVMRGELASLDQNGERMGPSLKMLAIALRNVRRLHQTVEWSQDLQSHRDAS